MPKLFFALLTLSFFISCSKNSDTGGGTVTPPVVIMPDTLAAGWVKANVGTTKIINDVYFVDNANGFACGDDGIFRSSDGGITWNNISSNYAVNIGASGATHACFATSNEKLYFTANGTSIQESVVTHLNSTPGFRDVFFSSSNICYASSGMYIWKSVNGGASFDTLYNFQSSIVSDNTLFFVNDLVGWINRGGQVSKTVDGGVTWNLQFSGTQGGGLKFINASIGFIAINNSVYKTVDGGATFQVIYPYIPGNLIDVDFVSATTGFISGNNRIYKTTDGGTSWTQIAAVGSPQQLFEIHFIDATHGWACGTNGLLLKFN